MCRILNELPLSRRIVLEARVSGPFVGARAGRPTVRRAGLTLLELLIATTMMLMLAGVLGGLAAAVQTSADYSQGHGDATQHARVALERITRNVTQATAAAEHPGFAVVFDQIGPWQYPDTLLVWRPAGAPANAAGPPLVRELVIYCPNPSNPEQLLEITAPTDSRSLPLDSRIQQSPWRQIVDDVKTSSASQRVVLTDLLRVASTAGKRSSSSQANTLRGAVRFEQELRPSAVQWSQYRAGTRTWENLSWPQGVYGSRTGLRHAWLRIELQLMPGAPAAGADLEGHQAYPFFGSAAVNYEMNR